MNRLIYTVLLLCALIASISGVLAATELFHRYVVIPRHEPRRLHLDAYLAAPKRFVAIGSSQLNMSLNINRPDFYNLAWRGETIAEQWLRLRILLRSARPLPEKIFLEVNAPTMISSGSKNQFFFYADYVTPDDLMIARSSGTDFQWPLLTQLDGPYRRELRYLVKSYLKGEGLAPTVNKLNYEILPNGYSYNVVRNKTFPSPVSKADKSLRVHPNFDVYFRRVLQEARAHNIKVALISTPFYKTLRTAFDGPPMEAVHAYISEARKEFGVEHFDFSAFSDDPADFWNEDHMSLPGATKFGEFAAQKLIDSP